MKIVFFVDSKNIKLSMIYNMNKVEILFIELMLYKKVFIIYFVHFNSQL